jgi:hypothetical protein
MAAPAKNGVKRRTATSTVGRGRTVAASSKAWILIQNASEDRTALDFALPDSIFGFHAQQAVEKLLGVDCFQSK